MNISVVKNNMYQSYSSCTLLENNLGQLISILNSVDDRRAYIVSDYIYTIDYTMSKVRRNFVNMLRLNSVELHIFFREFNNKNKDMISELNILSTALKKLSAMATKLYTLYKLAESMEFFLEYALNANSLRAFISNISKTRNDLQVFKMMIDEHNRKLVVGVRK